MKKSTWITLIIGIAVILLVLIVIFAVPQQCNKFSGGTMVIGSFGSNKNAEYKNCERFFPLCKNVWRGNMQDKNLGDNDFSDFSESVYDCVPYYR